MVVYVQDVLDVDNLTKHIAHGNITERFHPDFPELVIYNYAPNVAYEKLWDHETLTCRGLIVNLDTQEVLARPFKKFFNYGENKEVNYDLDAELYFVGDKADGSLGIGYVCPDGSPAVATRGSFTSDQAIHATTTLNGYEAHWIMDLNRELDVTPLYEIIYPDNRIVLDYGDRDELIYLGSVETSTGAYYRSSYEGRPGTLREVLAREDRPNAEGYVVWFDPYTAVKIKYQAYVELHKIVTGLNRKSVWAAIKEGPHVYDEMAAQLPDELFEWAKGVRDELLDEFAQKMRAYDDVYIWLMEQADGWEEFDRGRFARLVADSVFTEYRKYMFALLDGKPIDHIIWAELEPKGGTR